MSSPENVTDLLAAIRSGNHQAESELISLVYNELRRLASHYMRQERADHTLQTTALVHEAYLRLVKQQDVNWQTRAHFFAIAGRVMRRILVDHARSHSRSKRGGGQPRVALDDTPLFSPVKSDELIALDQALSKLAEEHPRQSQVVELQYFGGLSVDQIAEVLNTSPRTVKRDWSVARAWLHRELRGER